MAVVNIKVEVNAGTGAATLLSVSGALDKVGTSADKAGSKMSAWTAQQQRAAMSMSGMHSEALRMNAAMNTLGASAATSGGKMSAYQASLSAAGSSMKSLGTTITIAAAAIAAGIFLLVKSANDFESALAGVRKTVEGSESEIQALGQEFRDMAKEIPVSVTELLALGESAGQLGVAREDIAEFARVAAEMGTATNLSADAAATGLAQLANIMGTPKNEARGLADTLVELGNKGASTEQQILDMGLRIALTGKQIGLTENQVLGFSAALANVGIDAEAGGNAISKTFAEMELAIARGGDSLKNFQTIASLGGVKDFAETFKKDAAGAMLGFIKGLEQIQKSGGSVIGTLDALGISEIRQANAIKGLVANVAGLEQSLSDAGNAQGALAKEFAAKNATMAAQFELLQNRLKDVGITVGSALQPAFAALIGAVNGAMPSLERLGQTFLQNKAVFVEAANTIGTLGKAAFEAFAGTVTTVIAVFAKLPEPVRSVIVTVAALVAALGPLLLGLGAIAGFAGTAIGGLSSLAGGLGTAATAAATTATAIGSALVGGLKNLGQVLVVSKADMVSMGSSLKVWTLALLDGAKAAGVAVVGALRNLGASLVAGAAGLRTMAAAAVANAAAMGGQLVAGLKAAAAGMLGFAAGVLAVIAAFGAGWVVGTWIRDVTGLGKALDDLADKWSGLKDVEAGQSDFEKKIADMQKGMAAARAGAGTPGIVAPKVELPKTVVPPGAVVGLSALTETQKKAAEAAKQHAEAIQKLQDSLTGADLSKQASDLAAAVAGIDIDAASFDVLDRINEQAKQFESEGLADLPPAIDAVRERLMELQAAAGPAGGGGGLTGGFGAAFFDMAIEAQEQLKETEAALLDFGESAAEVQKHADLLVKQFEAVKKSKDGLAGQTDAGLQQMGDDLAKVADLSEDAAKALAELNIERAKSGQAPIVSTADLKNLEAAADAQAALGAAFVQSSSALAAFGGMIGGVFGSLVSGIGMATSAWGDYQGAMAAASKETDVAKQKQMQTAAKMQAVQAGLDTAVQVTGARMDSASTGSRALAGAAMGAKIGAIAGPWGMAAGAVVGAIVGAFKKPSWVKVGKDAGKILGTEISEELSKAIEADMKKLDLSAGEAALLHITDAAAESGKSMGEFFAPVQSLMEGIAAGTIPAVEGMAQLEEAFAMTRDQAQGVGDAMTVAMLQTAKATGTMTDGMKAFVSEQNQLMAGGASKIASAMENISKVGGPVGERAGMFFAVGFQAAIEEEGLLGAVDSLGDQAIKLYEKLKKGGNTAGAALIAPFAGLAKKLSGDSPASKAMRGQLELLEGMGDVFEGAANQGLLTADLSAAFGAQLTDSFNALTNGGIDAKTAMSAIKPELDNAVSAAAQLGVPLDANTQALKDQAIAMGFSFPTEPIVQLVDLMKTLVEGMGFALPASATTAAAAVTGLGATASGTFSQVGAQAKQGFGVIPEAAATAAAGASSSMGTISTAAMATSSTVVAAFDGVGSEITSSITQGTDQIAQQLMAAFGVGQAEALQLAAQIAAINNTSITIPFTFEGTIPDIPGYFSGGGGPGGGEIQKFQHGGFVPETTQGKLIRVAERGTGGEFMVPAKQLAQLGLVAKTGSAPIKGIAATGLKPAIPGGGLSLREEAARRIGPIARSDIQLSAREQAASRIQPTAQVAAGGITPAVLSTTRERGQLSLREQAAQRIGPVTRVADMSSREQAAFRLRPNLPQSAIQQREIASLAAALETALIAAQAVGTVSAPGTTSPLPFNLPHAAKGLKVEPRPGGTPVVMGEAGVREYAIPEPQLKALLASSGGRGGDGGHTTINVYPLPHQDPRQIAEETHHQFRLGRHGRFSQPKLGRR